MADSKYKPEYGPLLLELMTNGKSIVQVASKIGVTSATLYNWAQVFPEFKEYLDRGREASESYYEDKLQELAGDATLKSSAAVKALEFLMASRFKHDYAKTSIQHQEINVNHVHKLSDKELDAQIQRLIGQQPVGTLIEGELVDIEESTDEQ